MTKATDMTTIQQLRALRDVEFVVIHRE